MTLPRYVTGKHISSRTRKRKAGSWLRGWAWAGTLRIRRRKIGTPTTYRGRELAAQRNHGLLSRSSPKTERTLATIPINSWIRIGHNVMANSAHPNLLKQDFASCMDTKFSSFMWNVLQFSLVVMQF